MNTPEKSQVHQLPRLLLRTAATWVVVCFYHSGILPPISQSRSRFNIIKGHLWPTEEALMDKCFSFLLSREWFLYIFSPTGLSNKSPMTVVIVLLATLFCSSLLSLKLYSHIKPLAFKLFTQAPFQENLCCKVKILFKNLTIEYTNSFDPFNELIFSQLHS